MNKSTVRLGWLLCGVLLLPGTPSLAGTKSFTADHPQWREECGGCHIAYPPQLLSAVSWRAIMAGLKHHFGTDASLDAASAAAIGAFLERNAARGKYTDDAKRLRITETAWFQHEHQELPAAAWATRSVGSPTNCAACHPGAEQGNFRERDIRIPR